MDLGRKTDGEALTLHNERSIWCFVSPEIKMNYASTDTLGNKDFIEKSKIIHKDYSRAYWAGAFDPEHPDTKRHYNLLSSSDGLIDHINPTSILTVGDNLARDAGYFKRRFPTAKCVASDLYTDGIKDAARVGWVDDVVSADVEDLPFAEDSFDCVVAKEAFHHWPRPMLGLYEMLRVSRKAVVLIEPNDNQRGSVVPMPNFENYHDDYEAVGNYKYQISAREIMKSAWSLYYPGVAIVGFNDPYLLGQTYEDWYTEKQKLDALGDCGARQFNLICIVIYKPGYAPVTDQLPPRAHYFPRPMNRFLE
jgi:ubiquinone/menaquinone biosynthesis C-methylase UbiE